MLSTFGALFLGMFSLGFQITSVNRIFITTPKEVFEMSIFYDESQDHVLYFDNELLILNLHKYYSNNLKKYVTNYDFNLDYYNSNNEYCFDEYCSKVKVNLIASIAFDLKYQKSISYEIVRN
jgi:hypothetical protein